MIKENEKELVLSICITSYKRVRELQRCLESIKTIYSQSIEIVVSEDHSEQRELIRKIVSIYSESSEILTRFNSNEANLGYDRNLQTLIRLAKGKYILFLSDDDSLIEGALDKIIESLLAQQINVAFTPFIREKNIKRNYRDSFILEKGAKSIRKYLLDAILFSGLLFRKELVATYSAERFVNLNYFQVYLFLSVLFDHDGAYINIPLVNCNEDGENAFGIASSSEKNDLLSDRESVFSNLEFHKGLIETIRMFEQDKKTDIITGFSKEYSLRSYQGLSKARKSGIQVFRNYWKLLTSLNIHLSWFVYFYYFLLLVLGSRLSDIIIAIPKSSLLWLRKFPNKPKRDS